MDTENWDRPVPSGGRPYIRDVEEEIQERNLWRDDRVAAVLSGIRLGVIAAIGIGLVLFLVFTLACFLAVASHILLPDRVNWLSAGQLDVAKTVLYAAVTMVVAPLVAPLLGFPRRSN